MSGIKFSFKLKAAFGSIPSTEKIESEHKKITSEYLKFKAFKESDGLKHYLELEKRVQSESFKKSLEAIKADTFEKSPQYKQLKDFEALAKSSAIKKYFKYIQSDDYSFVKNYKPAATDGKQDSPEAKRHQKISQSSKYLACVQTEKSSELKKYFELEQTIKSDEFKKIRAEKEDKERYKQSAEYKSLQEFEGLRNSEEFKWYFKTAGSGKFTEIEKWELLFEDEFDAKNLDTDKWIPSYYYGKTLLNEPYSLVTDKHFPTDGRNIELKDSILNIVTKKETINGKVWDPKVGFYTKSFDYTSGMISTGESFRHEKGRFEAKVWIPDSFPVINSFWLSTGKMLPEINIFSSQANGKILLANHWGPKVQSSVAKLNGHKFMNQWFIFGLDWTQEKLTWTINGVVVREETNGLPKEPMFITFNSSMLEEPGSAKMPVSFKIDWVRVYQKAK